MGAMCHTTQLPSTPSPWSPPSHSPHPAGTCLAVRKASLLPTSSPQTHSHLTPAPVLHSLRVQAGGQ